MSDSTIALIIIGVCCVLYLTEIFSVAVTTMLGMLAFVFSGIISFQEAFSCFGSTAVMLTLGMIIIAGSMLESGVGSEIGVIMHHIEKRSEKFFVLVVLLSASVISIFTNNSAIVAMYMPFLASIAVGTKGHITKKNTYLPLAIGSLIGGTGSLAGGTAPLLANEVLAYSHTETMKFFTTAPIALCIIGVVAICYWLFIYKLQNKWLDFEDVVDDDSEALHEVPFNKKKAIISVGVFILCIVLFIIQPFGWDLGLIAVSCALILVVLKVVDGKKVMQKMQWSALVTLGAALGIAKGFVASGAGTDIIHWLIKVMGVWITKPVVLMTIFLLAAYVLSSFMSNGSLVSMLCAVAVPMAIDIGCNPIPIAMACVFGASLAMATPVATTTITMVQVAGYRFRDYFRIGGLVGVIGLATAWVALVLFYGLI